MTPQGVDVYDYMEEHGAITSLVAINEFGITRLSAVIYDLINDDGVQIYRQKIKVPTRRGTVMVTEYAVRPGDLQRAKGSEGRRQSEGNRQSI